MKKVKTFIVYCQAPYPDEDEFIIKAKSLREAKIKADKKCAKDYCGELEVQIVQEVGKEI